MSAKYVKDGVEFNCKIFFTFRAFSDHLLAVLAVLYQIIHIYPSLQHRPLFIAPLVSPVKTSHIIKLTKIFVLFGL